MGILDFFFGSSDPHEKHIKSITNMYVQPTEREYVISQLRDEASPKACQILLMRFSKNAPNTTVDLKEKELVYHSLVMLGEETDLDVVEIVKDHLRVTEDHINWPLRILTDLMSYEDFTAFVAELLSNLDTMYQRDPEKKHELLLRATELSSPELAKEVVPFLDDANDTIRFVAAKAAFAQKNEECVKDELIRAWINEDSVRNSRAIADGFKTHQWKIAPEFHETLNEIMPSGYRIDSEGCVKTT